MSSSDVIRRRSDRYGDEWCTEHAGNLGKLLIEWKKKPDTSAPSGTEVRVYDRQQNKIITVDLYDVFREIPLDECGNPKR